LIFMPLLGSQILQLTGWRSIFLMTVLHGSIVFIFVQRLLPETATTAHHRQHSVWQQTKHSFRLYFSNRYSLVPTAVLACGFGGFFTFISSGSTIAIKVYGLSATQYALLYMLPMGATALSAVMMRRWVLRHRRRHLSQVAVTSFSLTAVALAALAIASPAPSLWLLWPLIALYCFSYGLLLPLLATAVLEPLPEIAGFASSIMGTLQFGMATLMSAIAAFAYAGTARHMVVLMAVMAALAGMVYATGRRSIRLD
jgi:DHA1 family bicyclomycin/chloramphenicol resistance-like MFS transporter